MYILFDIGATNMRFAVSKDLRHFTDVTVVPNSRRYIDDIVAIQTVINQLTKGEKVQGMAGGIAGTFDAERGVLLRSPNMQDWINKPLAKDLHRISGVRPIIINDADVAGIGEAVYGAGHGYRVVAYMTISTGIGGALIIDGKPLAVNYSPEPGWQIIDADTKETLHQRAAGKDLEEKYNTKPKDLSPEVYQEVSHHLAVGIYNAILFWSPDIFVLGGSQMRDISVEDLNEYVSALSNNKNVPLPEIVHAKLGSENGLFGALELLRNK